MSIMVEKVATNLTKKTNKNYYDQKVIKTPNLDKLASEGLKFTQHYSGSPVCGPSRSVMLTGKHTGHTYLRGNGFVHMRPDPLDLIFPTFFMYCQNL